MKHQFTFNQRYRIAQVGTVASFYALRFRKGLLGSLIFTYFVCPEVFQPFKLSRGTALAEAEGQPSDTERLKKGAQDVADKAQRKGQEAVNWAKDKAEDISEKAGSRGRRDDSDSRDQRQGRDERNGRDQRQSRNNQDSDRESAYDRARDTARHYSREAQDKYQGAKDDAKHYARDLKHKAEDKAQDTKEWAKNKTRNLPDREDVEQEARGVSDWA